MNKYLTPREKYATTIYETILENGWTTMDKCGLSKNQADEGKEEFRDHPWKYGNKALICFDPWAGAYKFAESLQEMLENLKWHGEYITTRLDREVKVTRAYVDGYGSTRYVDRFIRTMEFANYEITDVTESGLYIAE